MAKAARSSSAAARAWIDARRRIAQHQRADLVGVLFQKAQRLGCGRGDGDEMIGRLEADALGQRLEILDQRVIGKILPDFFRGAGAALVVAQHAKSCGKPGRDGVPGMQRAAKLVQQHHGVPGRAGKRVMQAYAIGIDERQGSLLQNSQPIRRSSE